MAEMEQANTPLIDPALVPGAAAAVTEVPAAKTKKQIPDRGGYIWGVGRRKTSVARVRVKPGTGKFSINQKELKEYFPQLRDQIQVLAPLKATEVEGRFDIVINVKGGGTTGQAGAALLGIARALVNFDDSMEQPLRDNGLLTRDGRMVERKKPGRKGARKRFQFSKR